MKLFLTTGEALPAEHQSICHRATSQITDLPNCCVCQTQVSQTVKVGMTSWKSILSHQNITKELQYMFPGKISIYQYNVWICCGFNWYYLSFVGKSLTPSSIPRNSVLSLPRICMINSRGQKRTTSTSSQVDLSLCNVKHPVCLCQPVRWIINSLICVERMQK